MNEDVSSRDVGFSGITNIADVSVLLRVRSVLRQTCKVLAGVCISVSCAFFVPVDGDIQIGFDACAGLIETSEIVLGAAKTVFSGRQIPEESCFRVSCDTIAGFIAVAEEQLCAGMPALCGALIPVHCHNIVFGDPVAESVHQAEPELRLWVAELRQCIPFTQSRFIVCAIVGRQPAFIALRQRRMASGQQKEHCDAELSELFRQDLAHS